MRHDCPVIDADPDGCPVMVGMAHNATQDVLVCNRPMPCWMHPVPKPFSKVGKKAAKR